jgi:hypothetical protein
MSPHLCQKPQSASRRNPVVRGLVQEPEQWPWSSYRSYALGEAGMVRINQWGEIKIKALASAA